MHLFIIVKKKIKDFFYSAMNEFYTIELRTIFSFFFIENTWIKKKSQSSNIPIILLLYTREKHAKISITIDPFRSIHHSYLDRNEIQCTV